MTTSPRSPGSARTPRVRCRTTSHPPGASTSDHSGSRTLAQDPSNRTGRKRRSGASKEPQSRTPRDRVDVAQREATRGRLAPHRPPPSTAAWRRQGGREGRKRNNNNAALRPKEASRISNTATRLVARGGGGGTHRDSLIKMNLASHFSPQLRSGGDRWQGGALLSDRDISSREGGVNKAAVRLFRSLTQTRTLR